MKHFDSTHQMMLTREMNRTIKLGNLQIPAETQLYLPMTAIHHDTDIWGAQKSSILYVHALRQLMTMQPQFGAQILFTRIP